MTIIGLGILGSWKNFIERTIAVGSHYEGQISDLLGWQSRHDFSRERNEEYGEYLNIRVSSMEDMENQILDTLIASSEGTRSELADQLGISRTTLWKRTNKIT